MIVLGLNCYHANSSAALIVDGELVFAIEEERLNRIKNSGGFPFLSIKECLNFKNITLEDVNFVAINSDPKKFFFRKLNYLIKNPISLNDLFIKSKNISKKLNLNSELAKIDNYGTFKGKIVNVEHHTSHIASSFYLSNFDEACGISIDGSGDFTTTSNSICENDKIKMNDRIFYPHSLGIFYTAISNFLGFDKYGEEYKVMALGAYGNSSLDTKLSKLINFENDGKFNLNLDFFLHHKNINTFDIVNNEIIIKNLLNDKIVENLLGIKKRNRKEDLKLEHFNLAKSLQNLFEKAYLSYINFSYQKFQIENLCLAGGCAMNSLANGSILKKSGFKNIYIQPAAYDAGGAIGAATYCAIINGDKIKKNKNTKLYLGPKFTNYDVSKILDKYENTFKDKDIKVKKIENTSDLIDNIANLLIKKKIVGIFRDRLEWGARALGNRSIIADPRGDQIKDKINLKIKRRESFRPFAPMILKKNLEDWFLVDREIPSMMEVHKIKDEQKNIIPAVVHKDDTCRLQTVTEDNNFFMNLLLEKFNELTNVPILLNTSFNENEPIVCKPKEAIDTFLRTNMDVLLIEDYVLSRN